jgi:D-sedoheptulose 7-phosphate isomerase
MKASDYVDGYFLAAQAVAADPELKRQVIVFVDILRKLKQREGRLFVLGLGGSAANASHAVNDFRKIAGIETYAPTDNVAELTARTNDQDFDSCLSEWLKGSHLRAQDLVLILSTSGGRYKSGRITPSSSPLLLAAQLAQQKGAQVVSLLGDAGGILNSQNFSSLVILVPVSDQFSTPLAESFQAVVWHAACNALSSEERE